MNRERRVLEEEEKLRLKVVRQISLCCEVAVGQERNDNGKTWRRQQAQAAAAAAEEGDTGLDQVLRFRRLSFPLHILRLPHFHPLQNGSQRLILPVQKSQTHVLLFESGHCFNSISLFLSLSFRGLLFGSKRVQCVLFLARPLWQSWRFFWVEFCEIHMIVWRSFVLFVHVIPPYFFLGINWEMLLKFGERLIFYSFLHV